jgi:hypothetical protein
MPNSLIAKPRNLDPDRANITLNVSQWLLLIYISFFYVLEG